MYSIIICFGLGLVTLYLQIRRFIETKNKLKESLTKGTFEIKSYGKSILLVYIFFIVFGFISIFYTYNLLDYATCAPSIVLVCLGLGELINFKYTHTLYYNDDAIIINGNLIRYRSIKSISKRGLLKKNIDITTLKGTVETTSIIAYEYIKIHTKIKL